MTTIRTRRRRLLALALLLSAGASAAPPGFVDQRRIGPVDGDAAAGKAKAAVCMGCHGPVGIAPVPMFPNLAGQHAEYLYWQLVEIQREARPESPMTAQVTNLDDTALRDLATYFSTLPAAKPTSTDATNGRGGKLYREGDPTRGVPPCQGCHGADGDGHPLARDDAHWRAYPVLRGQHAAYVSQRLRDFRDGKHVLSSSDQVMGAVARTLDDDSIQLLDAWIEGGAR